MSPHLAPRAGLHQDHQEQQGLLRPVARRDQAPAIPAQVSERPAARGSPGSAGCDSSLSPPLETSRFGCRLAGDLAVPRPRDGPRLTCGGDASPRAACLPFPPLEARPARRAPRAAHVRLLLPPRASLPRLRAAARQLVRDAAEMQPRCGRRSAEMFGTTCAFDPAATPHSRLFPPRLRRYEFSRFNRDSGGERYFQLPRLRRIAKQCLEALVFVHR